MGRLPLPSTSPVTAITHRRDAVYPTTVVGLPPQEDYYLGKSTERMFLPLLKTIVHDIDDMTALAQRVGEIVSGDRVVFDEQHLQAVWLLVERGGHPTGAERAGGMGLGAPVASRYRRRRSHGA